MRTLTKANMMIGITDNHPWVVTTVPVDERYNPKTGVLTYSY